MFSRLFSLPRKQKQYCMLLTDIVSILLAYYLAYALRLNSWTKPLENGISCVMVCIATLLLTIVLLYKAGQYRTIIHYMSSRAVNEVGCIFLVSSASIYFFSALFAAYLPRTVPIIYLVFIAIFYGSSRMLIRNLYFYSRRQDAVPNVVIYGAGQCGTELAAALQSTNNFRPVAFVDDDASKQNSIIHGLRVYAIQDLEPIIRRYNVKRIVLAIINIPRSERKQLLEKLKPFKTAVMSVPSLVDRISTGSGNQIELEEIDVEDILGRDPVKPMEDLLFSTTQGRAVMVTGAGGSIGSELCRQIATHKPKRLVLYELSEAALYTVHRSIKNVVKDVEIIPCLGDVKNKSDLIEKFTTFGIQTVYHAAAYKHVPLVELNVIAGVQNNIFGTLSAAQAAIEAKVERFVLISTDKAVRPTNIMGTTKRMAELILQAYAADQDTTCFCMVRFGNVLNSSGSVFPLFRRQIAAGGPVTVTHPDVERFFMTIYEAVQLVLQASGMAKNGEVFVLDMGEPVKIIDMAREMIQLSGKTPRDAAHPDGDIEIQIVGLRPGEKLYEELLVADGAEPTLHPRIMQQKEASLAKDYLLSVIEQLKEACAQRDVARIIELLQMPATGYCPLHGPSDLVWTVRKPCLVTK